MHVIRAAREDDLPRLVELLSQLSIDKPREDAAEVERYRRAFEAVTEDPRQQLLVLETPEHGIVGTLVLVLVPNLSYRGSPWAVIENVVVDQVGRGKGYGEELVMHAVELARKAGCFKVSLTSNKQRPDAHRFYERLGFIATHEGFRIEFDGEA